MRDKEKEKERNRQTGKKRKRQIDRCKIREIKKNEKQKHIGIKNIRKT